MKEFFSAAFEACKNNPVAVVAVVAIATVAFIFMKMKGV